MFLIFQGVVDNAAYQPIYMVVALSSSNVSSSLSQLGQRMQKNTFLLSSKQGLESRFGVNVNESTYGQLALYQSVLRIGYACKYGTYSNASFSKKLVTIFQSYTKQLLESLAAAKYSSNESGQSCMTMSELRAKLGFEVGNAFLRRDILDVVENISSQFWLDGNINY